MTGAIKKIKKAGKQSAKGKKLKMAISGKYPVDQLEGIYVNLQIYMGKYKSHDPQPNEDAREVLKQAFGLADRLEDEFDCDVLDHEIIFKMTS